MLNGVCVCVCVCVESSDSISPDLICSSGKQTDVYWMFSLYMGMVLECVDKEEGVFAEMKCNMIPNNLT